MEEIKVKKKKPLFSRFEWICIVIFVVFGIVGIILHFLGYDDIKGNAAEVQTLASQTDYLLVSKTDPYIMIGSPDPDGELPVDVLKVDAFGFYNFFKVPTNISLTPFPITLEAWNFLFNQLFGQPASNKNDGSVLMRYRMSAGNLNEFTGYMPVTTISHQDYYVVKATLYAVSGAVAWLSTNNYIKASPVPRLSGQDLYNVYYFYVNENGSPHYYAVSSGGVLNLHRASEDDATARITYREGMVLYSYESNCWQGPINGSQSYFDSLGVPYVFNFENTAGMLKYDDECMCAVRMMSFEDQQVSPTPTVSPSPSPAPERSSIVFHGYSGQYFLIDFYGENVGNTAVTVPSNSVLQSLQTEYNSIDDVAVNSAFLMRSSSGGNYVSYINFWFNADSLDDVKLYILSSAPVDLDYVRDTVTPQSFTIQTVADGFKDSLNGKYQSFDSSWSGYLAKDGTTLKRFCLAFRYYYNGAVPWGVDSVLGSLSTNFFSLSLNSGFTGDRPFSWTYGSPQYDIGLRYQINFSEYNYPYVSPTPSPSPTPTQPPYIVIVTPQPEATPTPVVKLDPVFPSSMPPLNSGTVSSVLETGNTFLDNNNAITVLSRALAFFPNTVLSLWWFWLFVLVILAGIRVFIHFF